jgi:hypothetical protein
VSSATSSHGGSSQPLNKAISPGARRSSAHDVELTGDGGGKVPAILHPLRGRNRVARTLINWATRFPGVSLRVVEVNGGPGALYLDAQQRLIGVVALDIAGGQITSISTIVNPDRLTHLGPVADYRSLRDRRDDPQPRTFRLGCCRSRFA